MKTKQPKPFITHEQWKVNSDIYFTVCTSGWDKKYVVENGIQQIYIVPNILPTDCIGYDKYIYTQVCKQRQSYAHYVAKYLKMYLSRNLNYLETHLRIYKLAPTEIQKHLLQYYESHSLLNKIATTL